MADRKSSNGQPFSGTITDSLGRKVTYQNGKRVSGGQETPTISQKIGQGIKALPGKLAKGAVSAVKSGFGLGNVIDKMNSQDVPEGILEPEKPNLANAPEGTKLNPATYVGKPEREKYQQILGTDDWVLRKVTEKDVQKLDKIASQLKDPEQWETLKHIINKIDNAVMSGGYSFVPKGVIKQKKQTQPLPVKTAGSSPPRNKQSTKPKPTESKGATTASKPIHPSDKPLYKPPGDPNKRGIENTVPIEPSGKPLKTHSILSHRSPLNKEPDRPRTRGLKTYANVMHNQTEPTADEWKSLQGDLHKLGRYQLMRLVRRFGIKMGETEGLRKLSQLRTGVSDHISDILDYGAGPTGVAPELGKDRRSGKHLKEQFTHFRPLRKF